MNQVKEKAKLALGEDYKKTVSRVHKWVVTMLRKPWYDRNRLVGNEGGYDALIDNALAHIVAYDDVDTGLAEYGKYLASEYGKNRKHNKIAHLPYFADHSSLLGQADEKLDDQESTIEYTSTLPGSAARPFKGLSAVQTERPHVEKILRTEEERTLFQTIADVGSIAEAIRVLGWNKADAMRIWFRCYQRVRSFQ